MVTPLTLTLITPVTAYRRKKFVYKNSLKHYLSKLARRVFTDFLKHERELVKSLLAIARSTRFDRFFLNRKRI